MTDVVAIALAGGQGVRARPLSRTRHGIRSKAVVKIVGRPTIALQTAQLRAQGVRELFVAAHGYANRYQVRDVLGYGDEHGVTVTYSRVQDDLTNTGSGSATLNGICQWGLQGPALVLPTDSLFEFDVDELVRAHRAAAAVVTVGVLRLEAEQVAGTYGVVRPGPGHTCRGFEEKPSLARSRELAGRSGTVWGSAGLYVVDTARLAATACHGPLAERRAHPLDWGHDLVPWLTANGYPVAYAEIARMGDLGSPAAYLGTQRAVLEGGFAQVGALAGLTGEGPWIDPTSLARRDASGRTLGERMARGVVTIGPATRIGREVEIGSGVVVEGSDIGDGVVLGDHTRVRGSAVHDDTVVGSGARIDTSCLGAMSRVDSTPEHRTTLTSCAVGDEAWVDSGRTATGELIEARHAVAGDPTPLRPAVHTGRGASGGRVGAAARAHA